MRQWTDTGGNKKYLPGGSKHARDWYNVTKMTDYIYGDQWNVTQMGQTLAEHIMKHFQRYAICTAFVSELHPSNTTSIKPRFGGKL
jgi:hypothetical protein